MGQTVVEKIAQAHLADGPRRALRAGDFVSIRPRHILTHDNTAPVAGKFRAVGATRIHDPRQPVFALDHDIQNRSDANRDKYRAIEHLALEHEVDFYPAGTGIGHQLMIERLYALPGSFVVASDSHANTYGGVGAVGTPVVRTDAAAIWATGTFWWQIPRTVRVRLEGRPPAGVSGKDVILVLCGLYGAGEVLNAAVEFDGPGVERLDMDDRLAIANMTTEWGALVGWFPCDATTVDYLERRRALLGDTGAERLSAAELERLRRDPPRADPDASYAGLITLDLSTVTPHVAGPDTVQRVTPLATIERRRQRIDKAYIVSCANSRAGDLAAAAEVLRDRQVAAGVELYIAAASREVQAECEALGSWYTLLDAGARPLPPGCGPCIGLGSGLLAAGEVGISATNRNFKGRMGSPDAACYLASPAVVAASAAAGYICGPSVVTEQPPRSCYEPTVDQAVDADAVEILDGFPDLVEGRLIVVPQDNLNTDGIYGKDYTYRDDATPELMARVVFANYDPGLAAMVLPGDILLGGRNFGTGSSREQAVTALQHRGFSMVIAASFSQTYLRNAFNNGFPCVVCPELFDRTCARFDRRIEAGERTIVPGERISVDFRNGTIVLQAETFHFAPLGTVPQALVVAGGIENQIRSRLGL